MRIILSLLFIALSLGASANDALLHRLDSVVALRRHYMDVKEKKIRKLQQQYSVARGIQKLSLASELYKEYYTYRFDSAMAYANRERAIATRLNEKRDERLSQTHLAMLYAIGGYYSEAEKLLNRIPVDKNDSTEVFEHYLTAYWIYNYWSDYCRDKIFSPEYNKRKTECLAKALPYCQEKNSAKYYYLLAELAFCKNRPMPESTRYYLKAVTMAPVNTRIYASSAYGLARNYRLSGRMKEYEDWLIRAAISDQVNPLKENLALQELAMYLFKQDEDNAEKSTHYIYCSMEDAQFYNNRLRMLEISQRLPAIVSVYQKQINMKRRSVTILSVFLGLGVAFLLVILIFAVRQTRKAKIQGIVINKKNELLENLNDRLRKTDETRGKYMRLFMDLCAIYIGKMNDYRKLVMRKVKAHQVDDLLKSASSTKLTEQETMQFYTQFDKAFLTLYPSFVSEFNSLLKPESRIELSRDGSLPTEMRIYALVRLGVDESVEIATLLFYSPQTIYNYRTAIRKRAISPETFEDDIKAFR